LKVTPLGSAPVIKGWNEAHRRDETMGGKRQCGFPRTWLTAQTASRRQSPPNSTIIFDVLLLSVK